MTNEAQKPATETTKVEPTIPQPAPQQNQSDVKPAGDNKTGQQK